MTLRPRCGPAVVVASAAALFAGTPLWLRRRYVVVTVTGSSMEPTYHDSDRVLVRRTRAAAVHRGQIVVLTGPDGGGQGRERLWMIKRTVAIPGDPVPRAEVPALRDVAEAAVPPDHLVVLGDNPQGSFDSREYGYVPSERLLGVVVRQMAPLASPDRH